jgi:hypothetical protein
VNHVRADITVCATTASRSRVVFDVGRRHQHAHTKNTMEMKRTDDDTMMITNVRVSIPLGGDIGGTLGGGGDGVGGGGGPPGGGNDGTGDMGGDGVCATSKSATIGNMECVFKKNSIVPHVPRRSSHRAQNVSSISSCICDNSHSKYCRNVINAAVSTVPYAVANASRNSYVDRRSDGVRSVLGGSL